MVARHADRRHRAQHRLRLRPAPAPAAGSGTSARRRPAERAALRQHRPARHHRHPGLRRRAAQARLRRAGARRQPAAAPAGRAATSPTGGHVAARSLDFKRRRPGRHAGARRADPRRPAGATCRSAAWTATAATTRAGSSAALRTARARAGGVHRPDRARGRDLDAARARPWTRTGTCYVAVGNGASGPGDRYDHSDSVLKLSPQAEAAAVVLAAAAGRRDNAARPRPRLPGPGAGRQVGLLGRQVRDRLTCCAQSRLGGIGGQVGSSAAVHVVRRHGGARQRRVRAVHRRACARCASTRAGACTCSGTPRRRSPGRRSSAAAGSGRWTRTRACCTRSGLTHRPRPGLGERRRHLAVRHTGDLRAVRCSSRPSPA